MTVLPPELIWIILECAYYDAGIPDQKTLKACSLVSTLWREPAQSLLFRSVTLRGPHNGKAIKGFFLGTDPSSERGRMLGSCVRTVDMFVGIFQDMLPTISDFIAVLSRCSRLYELVLRISGVHEFDDETLYRLRQLADGPTPSSIRALSLMRCGVQSPILYQLLGVWPTIQFLQLGVEINATPPSQPANLRLYELILHRTPSHEIVRWLLSASETSLQIVDSRDVPGTEFDDLFDVHGPRLRSLRLMRYGSRAAAVIRRCPNLEELVLFQLSTFLRLVGLPQTLEHLSFRNFGLSANRSLQSVLAAIDALPRLRIVTCDPDTAQHVDFPALQFKCRQRGIELATDALPIWITDDPIHACRLPRRKSVSNFQLMN
ncbi:hypothetical protein AcW1_007487 [Taiwanofungus camphoratus]|nr:hypothetical protein AcW2_007456 [Antrodia cinnamomea]KAI0927192.1 hypothetical protein AcV5_007792 [Antrodia cinnamomea]KAI0947203.1 hypothetical protein AcV7_009687 [Antrodia cinnamomea]KAI0953208.1 hypothetical protein AcW1_007487 [Antrodia cinnamomea]